MPGWTGRIAKAAVAGAIAVTGVAVGTGSAHADSANECRSQVVGKGYYWVVDGVGIDSCYNVKDDGRTIYATVPFDVTNHDKIVICAHLLNANNPGGPWVHDFGCDYATSLGWGIAQPGYCCYGQGRYFTAPPGAYIVSAGFWLNGQYYGDVESPRTVIG
ncbi:hypothetical protein DN069_33560 [Streptacidiphilus pinicola]|uniref:Secreted protein n=1 Tax=Streptacidiphilus pinicola TaxID=2219663 RepID=A0A2X0K1V2_9ACTN|nr:hypothetical protein [Streptacidiphilus pinicola]RAG81320.1 hypothetical protein DN069_33560 [Streptacidiphilus pinicola]